ncbi:MAG: hypothetical protein JWQ11_1519 [Rhizobacter sp.]|nr:hypothetical protein [Rhizobacter sp.]
MNRSLHHAAFIVGLAAVCWVGAGYVGTNWLALAVTLLIAAFYLMGALELQRFHRSMQALAQALSDLPDRLAELGPWLAALPPGLRNAVRLRIEGERVGLPGPSLAPYVTGLLVLLGMLGTFLGMVVTLNGTGMALETAKDLQSIRASLSGPVRGLGLAFGTSIAGVATSAMLGLMSSLSRREALQTAQLLDTRMSTSLRQFSQVHRREETFRLVQQQAEMMPALVDRLQAMIVAVERQGELLSERLFDSHRRFQDKAEAAYVGLAASVDRSLRASLVESARIAGATIQPIVEATMAGIAREAASLHRNVSSDVAALHGKVSQDAAALHERVAIDAGALHRDVARDASVLQQTIAHESATLAASVARDATALQDKVAAEVQRQLDGLSTRFEAVTVRTAELWDGALDRHQRAGEAVTSDLRLTVDRIAATFEQHSASLLGQVGRSAADTIGELRQRLAESLAADNAMLDERRRVMETLAGLMESATRASTDQRVAIETMVNSSAELMDRVGRGFASRAEQAGETLATAAAEITGSAVEVASLGEAFGLSVQLFGQSNEKLVAQLQGIERALGKSMARSDEQLAYYVAQAREVIDLSIMSQKQIVEDLQQIASRQAAST